ncbi:unnamed protein product, partial [marine sediment metagenome]
FKTKIERLEEEIEKLDEIKDKFDVAGVEKEDVYFTENKQTLLGLDENELDFMIQEMVSFAEKQAEASADDGDEDDSNPKVPDFKTKKTAKKSPSEIAESLREIDKNKREHK